MPYVTNKTEIIQEISSLNVADQLNIITDIWNKIKKSKELQTVTKNEKKLLMDRLANYKSNPESAIDWTTLKQEVYDK